MPFKVVKQLKPIGAIKTFTKPNFNICMEEHLTILKNYPEKMSLLWIRTWRYMGPDGTKKLSIDFA